MLPSLQVNKGCAMKWAFSLMFAMALWVCRADLNDYNPVGTNDTLPIPSSTQTVSSDSDIGAFWMGFGVCFAVMTFGWLLRMTRSISGHRVEGE